MELTQMTYPQKNEGILETERMTLSSKKTSFTMMIKKMDRWHYLFALKISKIIGVMYFK